MSSEDTWHSLFKEPVIQIGVSTYSLSRAMDAGQMDIGQVIDWIAARQGEHVEIVPLGEFQIADESAARQLARQAADAGVQISSYTLGGNILLEDPAQRQVELNRMLQEIDTAAAMGVTRMRQDVARRSAAEATAARFEADFPLLVDVCGQLAERAAAYGLVSSVENHGFHLQASERVWRLVQAIDSPAFRVTLDVGNVLCVDEDPLVATTTLVPLLSMLHVKDFYIRPVAPDLGRGWFRSRLGRQLRGAIVGHGDLDLPAVLAVIKASGYAGPVSVEFEGLEDCCLGTELGMHGLRAMWDALPAAG